MQAPAQVDTRVFEVLQVPEAKLSDWLIGHLKSGAKVGFDPWLHTPAQIEELEKILAPKGIALTRARAEPGRRRLGQRPPGPADR